MDVNADTTSSLADHSTILERGVDAFDGIILHGDQETRAQLRVRCAGIEQSWGGVREVTLRHQVVGLDHTLDIFTVDADSHTHEEVLRAFRDPSIYLEKVRTLQSLESEAT